MSKVKVDSRQGLPHSDIIIGDFLGLRTPNGLSILQSSWSQTLQLKFTFISVWHLFVVRNENR